MVQRFDSHCPSNFLRKAKSSKLSGFISPEKEQAFDHLDKKIHNQGTSSGDFRSDKENLDSASKILKQEETTVVNNQSNHDVSSFTESKKDIVNELHTKKTANVVSFEKSGPEIN